jgi:hypothetical protein
MSFYEPPLWRTVKDSFGSPTFAIVLFSLKRLELLP